MKVELEILHDNTQGAHFEIPDGAIIENVVVYPNTAVIEFTDGTAMEVDLHDHSESGILFTRVWDDKAHDLIYEY